MERVLVFHCEKPGKHDGPRKTLRVVYVWIYTGLNRHAAKSCRGTRRPYPIAVAFETVSQQPTRLCLSI